MWAKTTHAFIRKSGAANIVTKLPTLSSSSSSSRGQIDNTLEVLVEPMGHMYLNYFITLRFKTYSIICLTTLISQHSRKQIYIPFYYIFLKNKKYENTLSLTVDRISRAAVMRSWVGSTSSSLVGTKGVIEEEKKPEKKILTFLTLDNKK